MKNPPADLFPANPPAAAGIALRPGGGGAIPLSAAQQRFNRLLARIERMHVKIAQLETLSTTYRPRYQNTLTPLRQAYQDMLRRMALWLDERLERKGLTPAQKCLATEILCGLCETLAAAGDEAMAALHDRRSPHSLREKEQSHAASMRSLMESMLGKPLDIDPEHAFLDPVEAVVRAGQESLQQSVQAERDKREAARARQKKKPTAAQKKADQQQENAETVLRQVYRQLVSALHPDRERDPAEHQRKTALMSQANAAYGRQDLAALLHLQLRIGHADPQGLQLQPAEKIAAMTRLLTRQATQLENALFDREDQLQQEFNLQPDLVPTAVLLDQFLDLQVDQLKEALASMQADLQAVQDDAGFKRWLRAQTQRSRNAAYF